MAGPRRTTIGERNTAAITEPDTSPTSPPPAPAGPVASADAPPAPLGRRRDRHDALPGRTARARQTGADTVRVGAYLSQEELSAAKSAYIADFLNGGDDDTFRSWVASALDTHAHRDPGERVRTSAPAERHTEARGQTNTWEIPAAVGQEMFSAMDDDQRLGHIISVSRWSAQAIQRAVDLARTANGGTLPPAPARLTARLRRRTRP